MAENERAYDMIIREAAATPGKRVLLVEGTGDVSFLIQMLDKPSLREENILADWVITPAGGKEAVIRLIKERPDFHAMVDRDTWDEEECKSMEHQFPHLHILPRFCIENFLICPDELEASIPGMKKFVSTISKEIPTAIRHACLWRAAQPLYEELLQAGFNRALLRYPPPMEDETDRLLLSWQWLLDPGNVRRRMKESFSQMKNQPQGIILRRFVHGKVFWKGCVEGLIAGLYPGKKNDALKREVYKRLLLPSDLEVFLRDIFLAE